MGKSSSSYHIYEAKREYSLYRRYPVELMMKHERSRPKGVAGKVDVLDELQIISCKRLTTVRRYGWLCFVLGSPHVLKSPYRPSALLSRHNISITFPFLASTVLG
jgi:hypothetical protein